MANFKNKRPAKLRVPCMCKAHKSFGNGKARWDFHTLTLKEKAKDELKQIGIR